MHKRFHLKNLFFVFALLFAFSSILVAQTTHTRNPKKETKKKDSKTENDENTESLAPKADEKTIALEKEAFALINAERKKEKHSELVWNEKLATVARAQSRAMAKYGFVSIKPYDGRDLRDHILGAGVKKWLSIGRLVAAGENTPKTVEAIVDRWLTSKERRRYVFENRWSETGIGIFVTEDNRFFLTLELLSK